MSAAVGPSGRLPLEVHRDTQVVAAAAAAVVLVGAVAVYSPKYAVAGTIAAGLVALAFWRLALGVAVFTVITFP
ncbi:MAG: hypothetical protein QOD43_461, partial [Gaiellaceae bacterium]|nr:hypothetical protein [Gaiellaceae bacterium]